MPKQSLAHAMIELAAIKSIVSLAFTVQNQIPRNTHQARLLQLLHYPVDLLRRAALAEQRADVSQKRLEFVRCLVAHLG